jgi:hypothetical protein
MRTGEGRARALTLGVKMGTNPKLTPHQWPGTWSGDQRPVIVQSERQYRLVQLEGMPAAPLQGEKAGDDDVYLTAHIICLLSKSIARG